MKKITFSILMLLMTAGITIKGQDRPNEYLGLPGDNLNLYAVLDLFQKSPTLEDFERNLNDPERHINNLDLNGDNQVDYIMVNDHPDGNVHNIVLQVAMGQNETQDVAVFTVQRFNNGSVQIQLIGDEALYGKNYILEPRSEETANPGYTGNSNYVASNYYEVSAWPLISFLFAPRYIVWHSAWHWNYYPLYWHPWRPFYYHYYYGYFHNWYPEYYRHYRHWDYPRYAHFHDFYYSHVRSYSPAVAHNIRSGHYRDTYSHPESRRDGEVLYARTHDYRSSSLSEGRRTDNNFVERSNALSGRRNETSLRYSNNIRNNNDRPVVNRHEAVTVNHINNVRGSETKHVINNIHQSSVNERVRVSAPERRVISAPRQERTSAARQSRSERSSERSSRRSESKNSRSSGDKTDRR